MKKYFICTLLLLLSISIIYAQSISMEFPAFAGKTYDFVIFQGSKAEKVVQDTIAKKGIIQSWVVFHVNVVNDKNKFEKDFTMVSNKITNPKKYTDWVGKVTYTLTQFGKDDFIEAIAPTVIGSQKITSYEGKTMQVYVKAMIGCQTPDLVITEHIGKVEDHNHKTTVLKSSELATKDYQQTLLIFYQSGCSPCEELMQKLPQQYATLKSKGIRVITISADEGEQVFINTSKNYPWEDKYCDYEGINGINFKNYAVLGTPTIYVIDKSGKIEAKLAAIGDILNLIK